MLFVAALNSQYSSPNWPFAMMSGGSIQSVSNRIGLRSGVRSRSLAAQLCISNEPNSMYCVRDELLHKFHEAGIYDYAQAVRLLRNGNIAVTTGMNIVEKYSEPQAREGGCSSTISNGMPAEYSGFYLCSSVPLVSMDSGSLGSSDVAMIGPSPSNAVTMMQRLDVEGNGLESPRFVRRRKQRVHRSFGGEKGGRGLRHFSMKVCEKVESKGWTTYNEVASELVAEFVNPGNTDISHDQQQYDEKNIRRRVYDALNVLMAMDIISKEKKEIQWKGLPTANMDDIEQLKREQMRVIGRIKQKTTYLQELEEQMTGLQNLVQRNERLYGLGNTTGGVALPFILVKTQPHATVEIEISEDMQLVHFDFNSTPFELHDDAYVLRAMQLCKRAQGDNAVERLGIGAGFGENYSPISNMDEYSLCSYSRTSVVGSCSVSSICGEISTSQPFPGILKARVKMRTSGGSP